MTSDFKTQTGREIQHAGLDPMSPLASRSLFWRARYLANSPVLAHLPLLFWLTETLRPRVVVTLGIADPVAHLAVCQAVEKLGLDSFCCGTETADSAPVSADILSYNDTNYGGFSRLVSGRTADLGMLLQGGKADLLIVNEKATEALIDRLETTWLRHLSDKGVVAFLRGGPGAAYEAFLARSGNETRHFVLDPETQACLMFYGSDLPGRLDRLSRLNPTEPGYLATRAVFARLGELHVNAQRLRGLQHDIQTVTSELAAANSGQEAGERPFAPISATPESPEIEKLRAHIAKVDNRRRAEADRTAFLEEEAEERYADIARLGMEIGEMEGEIATLKALVSEKNTALAEMKKTIAEKEAELKDTKAALKEKEREDAAGADLSGAKEA